MCCLAECVRATRGRKLLHASYWMHQECLALATPTLWSYWPCMRHMTRNTQYQHRACSIIVGIVGMLEAADALVTAQSHACGFLVPQ